jgi:hypothetical protein
MAGQESEDDMQLPSARRGFWLAVSLLTVTLIAGLMPSGYVSESD